MTATLPSPARNNAHGVFSTVDDNVEGMRWALSQQLDEPTIEIVGCVALFTGRT